MKVFLTTSTRHLQRFFTLPIGACSVKKFSDNELAVMLDEDVSAQRVAVVTATPAPAENILELLFLLDTLQRAHAIITLFFLYFGYARQDKVTARKSSSAQVVAQLFKQFVVQKTFVLHIHNLAIAQMYDMHNVFYWEFFYNLAHTAHVIVAPDFGARVIAKHIGVYMQKEVIFIEKKRISNDRVELSFDGSLDNKDILIVDDMISTGRTMFQASQLMKDRGAGRIVVAATHGLFNSGAFELLNSSSIERLYVTNSLAQINKNSIDFCEVINIVPYVEQYLFSDI